MRNLIVSEIELAYRSKVKSSERPLITTSKDAYELLLQLWDATKLELLEEFKVLLLNRANKVLALYDVSSGGMSGTIADPKLAFCAALKVGACGMIIAHNHPSGSLKPSSADEELAIKFSAAGKFLDIRVIDSLIITQEGYYSFADEGVL